MKKIFLLLVCILLLLSNNIRAQITFQKTYGGIGIDYGHGVIQTADSGYIVWGFTKSFGGNNFHLYLIKTNTIGDTLWTRVIGSTLDGGKIYSVIQTADGGYVFTGGHDSRPFLMKMDANGNLLWEMKYETTQSQGGFSVQQTNDGGYVFVTSIFDVVWNICLFKTDSAGNIEWIKEYQTLSAFAYCIRQTADNGYVITGMTGGNNYSDALLIKTDSLGNTSWTPRVYHIATFDVGWSVLPTNDGGFIIAGSTGVTSSGDVYVIKTDATGYALWSKTYDGYVLADNELEFMSIQNTNDGNYFMTAATYDSLYVLKINTIGDVLWAKTYGGGNESYVAGCGQQTFDGGYVFAGTTISFGAGNYDVYVIKTDSNGNSGCYENDVTVTPVIAATQTLGFIPVTLSVTVDIDSTSDSIVSGATVTTLCLATGIDKIPQVQSWSVFPNPASGKSFINYSLSTRAAVRVELYDVLGNKLKQLVNADEDAGEHNASFDAGKLANGVYLLQIHAGNQMQSQKIVVMN